MISKIFRRNEAEAALAPGDAAFMNDIPGAMVERAALNRVLSWLIEPVARQALAKTMPLT